MMYLVRYTNLKTCIREGTTTRVENLIISPKTEHSEKELCGRMEEATEHGNLPNGITL
jgi:hypothetical protein